MLYKGDDICITRQDLCYFSGGNANAPEFPKSTIHTDINFAKNCGFNKLVASGAMFEGMIADLISDIEGIDWFTKGRMKIKFVDIVTAGDTITPYAVETKYGYDVWCENQYKIKTCVGQVTL